MKCHDCNSTMIIHTNSDEVCHNCGLVHSSQIYDYGPQFEDNQDYDTFEPILDNNKHAIDTVKRLKNWINLDISLPVEMTFIREVERLADELLLYDKKCYPSQYYWAGAIVYARKYDHITRRMVIEYLYGSFDSGCERMHKKFDKIIREKRRTTNTPENVRLIQIKNELNNKTNKTYDDHLKEYWVKKIVQVQKLRKNGKRNIDDILENTRIDRSTYYKNKKMIMHDLKHTKQYSNGCSIYDKYPVVGNLIMSLKDQGLSYEEIQQYIINEGILMLEADQYLEVAYRTVDSIMDYVNSQC